MKKYCKRVIEKELETEMKRSYRKSRGVEDRRLAQREVWREWDKRVVLWTGKLYVLGDPLSMSGMQRALC